MGRTVMNCASALRRTSATPDASRASVTALLIGLAVSACGGLNANHIKVAPVVPPPASSAPATIKVVLEDRYAGDIGSLRNLYKPGPPIVQGALLKALTPNGKMASGGYSLDLEIQHGLILLGAAYDPMLLTVRTAARVTPPGEELPVWGDVFTALRKLRGREPVVRAQAGETFSRTLQELAESVARVDLDTGPAPGVSEPLTSPLDLPSFYARAERLFGFTANELEVSVWNATVPTRLVEIATSLLPQATQVGVRNEDSWGRSNSPLYAGVSRLPHFDRDVFQCRSPLHVRFVRLSLLEQALFLPVPAGSPRARPAVGDLVAAATASEMAGAAAEQLALPLFAKFVAGREQMRLIAYERTNGTSRAADKMAATDAASPDAVLRYLSQPPADEPQPNELFIDGIGFCLSFHAVGNHAPLPVPGEAESEQRHHYNVSFSGLASLRPFAAHVSNSPMKNAVDSLRLYAAGPSTAVDSSTVLRWLGQPQSRTDETPDASWWRYTEDVVRGQRRIGEIRIVKGRLAGMHVLIGAGTER